MAVTAGAENPGPVSFVRILLRVENAGFRKVEVVDLSIFSVHVEDCVSEHANRLGGFDGLPEHVGRIEVGPDTVTSDRAMLQHRPRAIRDKSRMHFDRDFHAVIFGKLAVLSPEWSDFLLP